MRIATALLCILAACCSTATGSPVPPIGSEAPPSVAKFALSYQRSGGFAPDPRSLRIKPGRHAIARRGGLPSRSDSLFTVRFRIGVKQVKRLRTALERADFQAIVSPGPNSDGCADCYSYSIAYRGHRVTFSEAALPGELRPVVGRLEAIIAHHLPFH
jgi:hypothetical protein